MLVGTVVVADVLVGVEVVEEVDVWAVLIPSYSFWNGKRRFSAMKNNRYIIIGQIRIKKGCEGTKCFENVTG